MANDIGKNCPYCQFPIKPGEPIVYCSKCRLAHHRECWEHNGNSCTTFGCDGTASTLEPLPNRNTSMVLDLDLDDANCPSCGAGIDPDAKFCGKCGAKTDGSLTSDPNIFCVHCGGQNKQSNIACIHCGNSLRQTAKSAAPAYNSGYSQPTGGYSNNSGNSGQRPTNISVDNNMALSIFCLICCCQVLGIVAVVYSSKVKNRLINGDVTGAREAAESAHNWAIAGIVIGVLIIYIIGFAMRGS
ncbi:MAG: CD225/dispanin family protein [Bacillota bacterium]